MDSSSGRSLTSFNGQTSDTSALTSISGPLDPTLTNDSTRFIPTVLDFANRALQAEDTSTLSVPPVFLNAQAVDSASFAGQGASFAVYRRRIPGQKVIKSSIVMDGWSVEIEDIRKIPDVVAYKVALIEFSDEGEATGATRHAIDAAIMELYLSAHRPILQHPNIVDFLGLAWGSNPFDCAQKLPVLIVEFAECGSLWQLQQREFLGIETRRRLSLDMCQGLRLLHSCGIVHGDMKAENVLIFPDSEHLYKAKLSDFGYSVVLNAEENSLFLGGTRPWKAPEAKTAVRVSDAKYTDIYSLALLIWCTFAHGRNIFRLLVDPSKQGEEFHAEVENMKETGELVTKINLSAWYLNALKHSSYGDPLQIPKHLISIQQQLRQDKRQPSDVAVGLDAIEQAMCAIPSIFSLVVDPFNRQLFDIVQLSGLYGVMERAVTIGLSNDPSRRDLRQIMACLGGDGLSTGEMYQNHGITTYCKKLTSAVRIQISR